MAAAMVLARSSGPGSLLARRQHCRHGDPAALVREGRDAVTALIPVSASASVSVPVSVPVSVAPAIRPRAGAAACHTALPNDADRGVTLARYAPDSLHGGVERPKRIHARALGAGDDRRHRRPRPQLLAQPARSHE